MGAWIETNGGLDSRDHVGVAPYVGAWIETVSFAHARGYGRVAPYVGAWIETIIPSRDVLLVKSHPTWVRGLKPCHLRVAIRGRRSHPTWVRGLKQPKQSNRIDSRGRTLRGCVD